MIGSIFYLQNSCPSLLKCVVVYPSSSVLFSFFKAPLISIASHVTPFRHISLRFCTAPLGQILLLKFIAMMMQRCASGDGREGGRDGRKEKGDAR